MIKCKRCGYKWETKSKMRYVSCPNCLTKVKNTLEENNEIRRNDAV